MTMRREIAYETDLHGLGEYLSAGTTPGGRVPGWRNKSDLLQPVLDTPTEAV